MQRGQEKAGTGISQPPKLLPNSFELITQPPAAEDQLKRATAQTLRAPRKMFAHFNTLVARGPLIGPRF